MPQVRGQPGPTARPYPKKTNSGPWKCHLVAECSPSTREPLAPSPASHSGKTEKQFRSPAPFTSSIARRAWGQHPQGRCQTSHGFHLAEEEVVFRGHSLSSVLTASHCLSSGFPQTQPGSAHLLVCLFIVYLFVHVAILFRGLI